MINTIHKPLMKTFTLITFLFLSAVTVNGQDYIISFAGKGASQTVNSVRVENLTQGKNITLSGSQSLHLVKSATQDQTWQFNSGDHLKFEGTFGKYTTIVMDVPSQSKTISFDFIECTDGDGNNYPVVKIGNQIWMAKNLAYLPKVNPPSQGSYTDPNYYVYGYYGNSVSESKATDNYKTYGVLYNWPAAQKACPNGWHLPSDNEWKQLELAIGMSQSETDDIGWRGTNEGPKLKAITKWKGNGIGTDDFGFSGLPSGARRYYGDFKYIEFSGYWWSSVENINNTAWYRYVSYYYTFSYRYFARKEEGLSVRCVKD